MHSGQRTPNRTWNGTTIGTGMFISLIRVCMIYSSNFFMPDALDQIEIFQLWKFNSPWSSLINVSLVTIPEKYNQWKICYRSIMVRHFAWSSFHPLIYCTCTLYVWCLDDHLLCDWSLRTKVKLVSLKSLRSLVQKFAKWHAIIETIATFIIQFVAGGEKKMPVPWPSFRITWTEVAQLMTIYSSRQPPVIFCSYVMDRRQ